MVKRYSGGLVGSSITDSNGLIRTGIYSPADHAKYDPIGQWPELAPPIKYMVVAGGGGGGRNDGGGGGGGGLLTNVDGIPALTAPGTTYTVVVGAGGPGQSVNTVPAGSGSNSFIIGVGKNSPSVSTYAGFFAGTGSTSSTKYICTLPANAAFAMGSGNFTIEGWFYVSGAGSQQSAGTYRTIASTRATNTTSATTSFSCGINPAGGVYFYTNTLEVDTATDLNLLNKWAHIAWVRSGTTLTVYVNGVSVGTGTSADNLTINTLSIGGNLNGSESWEGLMSNLRITKGVAVYTGNFTVPAMPITATQSSTTNISAITAGQCSLLTFQNSTVVDNSGNSFTITQVGTIFMLAYGSSYILLNAIGGGYGGGNGNIPGASGGSGGGGGNGVSGGTARPGQGYNGGSGTASTASPYAGAGGGGAGGTTTAATSSTATIGGPGASNNIISSTAAVYYAGGGSGCGYTTAKTQADGGGAGSSLASGTGVAGTANRGGGGGGSGYNGSGANSGGSGIVVISYPSYYPQATSTTGSPTYSVNGNNRVYTFTSSGTITF